MFEPRKITDDMLDKSYKATQLKDGRWFIRLPVAYDSETKKYRYKTIYGKNSKDALKNARRFIRDTAKADEEISQTEDMFCTIFENWLYGVKFVKVKSTTFDRYEQTYLYQIKDELEGIKLNDVSASDLKRVLSTAFASGYSHSSILKCYRLLVDFYGYLLKNEYILKNPMLKVEMYKKDEVVRQQERLREIRDTAKAKLEHHMPLSEAEQTVANSTLRIHDKEDIRILTDEEIERLKDIISNGFYADGYSRSKNLKTYGPFFISQGKVFLFMLNTGLRTAEMLGLRYKDVDWENHTIAITKNIVSSKVRDEFGKSTGSRKTKQGKTKTKQSHNEYLEINPTALQILCELQSQEPAGYDGYIVHNGDNPLSPRSFAKRFYNLLHAASIEQTGLHCLRHTFASKLYEKTHGDTKLVSELLRHTSVSFTAQTYIHLESKYKKKRLQDFAI